MERSSGETRRIEIDYVPLPSQSKFHASTARFKGFSGPIGSGKSQALCQEAIRLSYLNPGRQGLSGRPDLPNVEGRDFNQLFRGIEPIIGSGTT